jgi:hypothetical protein
VAKIIEANSQKKRIEETKIDEFVGHPCGKS